MSLFQILRFSFQTNQLWMNGSAESVVSRWIENRHSLVRLFPANHYYKQVLNDHADEQLQSLLLIRLSNPSSSCDSPLDPSNPPHLLISFLSHLQIALEATYISPHPASLHSPSQGHNSITTLAAPPRSDSVGRIKPPPRNGNPSIFPPATPNPTPSTTETDRQYVQAEGTLLLASIWGQGGVEDGAERFTLLWSEKDQVWVAVYRLSLTICMSSSLYANIFYTKSLFDV